MSKWDLLFSEYDLRDVLANQLSSVGDRVIKIHQERFERESDEMLAAAVASELVVAPLELTEEEISVSSRDSKVDVSQDFNRAVFDRTRPAYVDGIEVTYHVPFRGDKELLRCSPDTFTFSPPYAVLAANELQFPYKQADRNVAVTKQRFTDDLQRVKEWIPRVNGQVTEYNSSVESAVRQRVTQRRQELERTNDDLGSLGFKVRSSNQVLNQSSIQPSSEEATAKRAEVRKRVRRKYDVALSFAGEDRGYVEQVAGELRNIGVTVFYDRFEEVELWGKDLAEHLGRVYGTDSRFVVLFLSRAYAAKAWPRHEKQFALGRQIKTGEERILPVRFDETEIPGLPPTIAYLDLRVLTPAKLAELIRQKVDRDAV